MTRQSPVSVELARRRVALVAVSILLGSCASPPERLNDLAGDLGLAGLRLRGEKFDLMSYGNRVVKPSGTLHVYLEGDGTPWITRTRIAADPTSRDPLALRLMALDPAPSAYIGRPCYNGTAVASVCNPWLWTSGRYSKVVVESMEIALRNLIHERAANRVTLIGYSGGGVLAWLLAQRIPEVTTLVTVAANLDIDRWADRHGFSRLSGSINPATGPPMRSGVEQWHLVGRDDRNVPPDMISALADKLGSNARVLDEISDHHCCWLALWPGVLRQLP